MNIPSTANRTAVVDHIERVVRLGVAGQAVRAADNDPDSQLPREGADLLGAGDQRRPIITFEGHVLDARVAGQTGLREVDQVGPLQRGRLDLRLAGLDVLSDVGADVELAGRQLQLPARHPARVGLVRRSKAHTPPHRDHVRELADVLAVGRSRLLGRGGVGAAADLVCQVSEAVELHVWRPGGGSRVAALPAVQQDFQAGPRALWGGHQEVVATL